MDEQARRVAPEAWLRWFWLWDSCFAVGFVAVCALVLVETDQPLARRWFAVGVLAAMAVWYAAYGRRVITYVRKSRPWPPRLFVAGLVLLLVVAIALNGTTSFALFAVCPLIFMSLDLKEAIAAVVVVSLLPPLSVLVQDGPSTMFTALGPTTVLTLVFGVVIGTWIHRIVTQSAQRAALIEELEQSREEIGRLSHEAGVVA
ncbi:MAG: sensor histidine kinase, partial [Pseudonocardiaceae bacterium]|nr:sensor histidine kinase [Pseudonocardiaceae bacterium]